MKQFYVYILSSKTGTLYTGVTNNLKRRLYEHKHKLVPGLTAKYGCNRLMYYDVLPRAGQAIAAEKRIKGWTRAKKVVLVSEKNPKWQDLTADWERPNRLPDPIHRVDGRQPSDSSSPKPRDPSLRSG